MKTFPGVRALDGMNLRLRKGTVHVICGENGAGKSVMMKIINGTLMTDSLGQVSFETMMDTAAELGIETLEITTGGYSSAPHLDLDKLLSSADAPARIPARHREPRPEAGDAQLQRQPAFPG